jgi:hypothetical protein
VEGFEIEPLDDLARADALVARRIDELELPTWPTDPPDAHVALHEDDDGVKVAFVMNPTEADLLVRVAVAEAGALVDLLDEQRVARTGGAFEMMVRARTVRMMGVES